ncbi:MAG: hypothetical protein O3B13_20945 [Planctomycetota bacterium]|nr:hypothetical protein [Planctomycetota bacterium]MDA1165572.1 hypothetical protein [Planctomycetota bacterium]
MKNQLRLCFGLSLTAMILSGCGSGSAGPESDKIDVARTADAGQVTFLVEGMTERLSIY